MSNDITSTTPPVSTVAAPPTTSARSVENTRVQIQTALEPAAKPATDPHETRRILEETSKHMNEQMSRNSRDLSFSVDSEAHKIVLTVKNRDSGEVIRQIPSEVALRVTHNLDNVKGLFQDKNS
jgi:flagellar protein FlaG